MKYKFIEENRSIFSVKKMAKLLNVSRSSFYLWRRSGDSPRKRSNQKIDVEIKCIFEQSRQTYGSPRVKEALREKGYICSKNKVAQRMKTLGLKVKTKRKYKVTTDSKHSNKVSPNLLDRNFTIDRPNLVWTSDITYIWTTKGWAYLVVFIDLFSRKIVGWHVDKTLKSDLVEQAFKKAVNLRRPGRGLMIHSDRGVQYTSKDFRKLLKKYGCIQSMSKKGDCWDNAPSESFFATLKKELIYRQRFYDLVELKHELFEYIEYFYNRYRKHSTLLFLSPEYYENMLLRNVA